MDFVQKKVTWGAWGQRGTSRTFAPDLSLCSREWGEGPGDLSIASAGNWSRDGPSNMGKQLTRPDVTLATLLGPRTLPPPPPLPPPQVTGISFSQDWLTFPQCPDPVPSAKCLPDPVPSAKVGRKLSPSPSFLRWTQDKTSPFTLTHN